MATSTIQVAEMAIATFAAAGIASYLVLKLTNGSRSEESKYNYHPYPRTTFLQNDRTIIPNDDAVLAQPRGWSMEDALKSAKDGSARAKAMTPAQVLQSLQKGNSRFWTGQAQRPEVSAFERRVLIKQQFPSTAILGCSDSRVPVEIVFDQGLGDMFVVRVAGNCLGPTTQASRLCCPPLERQSSNDYGARGLRGDQGRWTAPRNDQQGNEIALCNAY